MPNKQAQAKSVRQSRKHNLRNKAAKSVLRQEIKKARNTLDEKKTDEAKTNVKTAIRVINKTAEKGIIHKRKAARLESRLVKRLNKISSPASQ